MADIDESTERKPRKSVAFSDGATIVDENGEVTQANGHASADTTTAESHAPSADKEMDEVTDLFKGLAKKKKKKSKDDGAAADGGEFDPSALKKKKKKPKTETTDEEAFEAKLAEAVTETDGGATEAQDAQDGDMEKGTGIWGHDSTTPISYQMLLKRFFNTVATKNPDILSSGSKSYKIPPPQCLREGNKKTIFANISDISKRMNRADEHVTQFLFAELGTNGSVDGSKRLVIKGRFQQKQIENVLRRYIVEYVTCKTCRSQNTELSKGENRLYFLTCSLCGSRRSVAAIKTGFTAQIGKRKRQQG